MAYASWGMLGRYSKVSRAVSRCVVGSQARFLRSGHPCAVPCDVLFLQLPLHVLAKLFSVLEVDGVRFVLVPPISVELCARCGPEGKPQAWPTGGTLVEGS